MLSFQLVRLEPVRSADPPRNSGSAGASAWIAFWLALRVAMFSFFSTQAALELGGLLRELRAVGIEFGVPFGFDGRALLLGVPRAVHFGRDLERGRGPAQVFAHRGDFLVAQRGAVH